MSSLEANSSHTNWAMIFDAARGVQLPANTALEKAVKRYWPAMYAYLRRSGCDVHEAADLTQGFVCDVLLGRNLFDHADPNRGRFRNLLMTALKNYLREARRRESAQKRGEVKPLKLEEGALAAAETGHLGASHQLSPEQAFCAQWNATLVRQVLERVRVGCLAGGLDAHWQVFEARVARPMLFGESPAPYARLVERFELNDAGQAANMMLTVKRRFVQELVREVGRTVSDPLQIEEELRELLRELEAPS